MYEKNRQRQADDGNVERSCAHSDPASEGNILHHKQDQHGEGNAAYSDTKPDNIFLERGYSQIVGRNEQQKRRNDNANLRDQQLTSRARIGERGSIAE